MSMSGTHLQGQYLHSTSFSTSDKMILSAPFVIASMIPILMFMVGSFIFTSVRSSLLSLSGQLADSVTLKYQYFVLQEMNLILKEFQVQINMFIKMDIIINTMVNQISMGSLYQQLVKISFIKTKKNIWILHQHKVEYINQI